MTFFIGTAFYIKKIAAMLVFGVLLGLLAVPASLVAGLVTVL